MSLAVQDLFRAKQRELSQPAGGTAGTRFAEDFVLAVNRSLSRLTADCNLATALTHITATDATITELDASDEYILSAGVTHHMLYMGYGREKADVKAAQDAWDDAVATYAMNAVHDLMADDDNDVVGLGAIS